MRPQNQSVQHITDTSTNIRVFSHLCFRENSVCTLSALFFPKFCFEVTAFSHIMLGGLSIKLLES